MDVGQQSGLLLDKGLIHLLLAVALLTIGVGHDLRNIVRLPQILLDFTFHTQERVLKGVNACCGHFSAKILVLY